MFISKIVVGSLAAGVAQATGDPSKSIQVRLFPLVAELLELSIFALAISLIIAPLLPLVMVIFGLFTFTAFSFGVIIAINPDAFKNKGDYKSSGLFKRLVVAVSSGLVKVGASIEGASNENELANVLGNKINQTKALLPISLSSIAFNRQAFLHYSALLYGFYIKSAIIIFLVVAAMGVPFFFALEAGIAGEASIAIFTILGAVLANFIVAPIQKKMFKVVTDEVSSSGKTLTNMQMGIFGWCHVLSMLFVGTIIAWFKLPHMFSALKSPSE